MLTRLPDALLCAVFSFCSVYELVPRATTCKAWNRCMRKPESLPRRTVGNWRKLPARMLRWLGECGVCWRELHSATEFIDVGPFHAEDIEELGISFRELLVMNERTALRLRPRRVHLVYPVGDDQIGEFPRVAQVLEHVELLSITLLAGDPSCLNAIIGACPRLRILQLDGLERPGAGAVQSTRSGSFQLDLTFGMWDPDQLFHYLAPWTDLRPRLRRVQVGIQIDTRGVPDAVVAARRRALRDIAALDLPIHHIWLDDWRMSVPVERFPHLVALDWGELYLRTRADIEALAALAQRSVDVPRKRARKRMIDDE